MSDQAPRDGFRLFPFEQTEAAHPFPDSPGVAGDADGPLATESVSPRQSPSSRRGLRTPTLPPIGSRQRKEADAFPTATIPPPYVGGYEADAETAATFPPTYVGGYEACDISGVVPASRGEKSRRHRAQPEMSSINRSAPVAAVA